MKGYDYDGVITKGIYPGPDDVIITGRSCSPEDVVRTYADMAGRGLVSHDGKATGHQPLILQNAVYFMPTVWKDLKGMFGLIETGRWKALMIDALGLDEFFEDDPVQIKSILDHMKGNCKITKV